MTVLKFLYFSCVHHAHAQIVSTRQIALDLYLYDARIWPNDYVRIFGLSLAANESYCRRFTLRSDRRFKLSARFVLISLRNCVDVCVQSSCVPTIGFNQYKSTGMFCCIVSACRPHTNSNYPRNVYPLFALALCCRSCLFRAATDDLTLCAPAECDTNCASIRHNKIFCISSLQCVFCSYRVRL